MLPPPALSSPALLAALLLVACDCGTPAPRPDGGADGDIVRCGPGDDPDGDGVSSMDEGFGDPEGDGLPRAEDPDADGDGLADALEAGDADCLTPPVDTDGDGMPDLLDLDSDGDSIADADEGPGDADGDGEPNFRDLDADGDGVSDAEEAGDGDPETPPARCAEEPVDDGFPDFLDLDADDDGLADGEEGAYGTARCGRDTDADGAGDLIESARERVECPGGEGEACGCATDGACGLPAEPVYVVVPRGEGTNAAEAIVDTALLRADVFFLLDTTESMGDELDLVKATVAAEGGLVARIREVIPEAFFGGGQHDDFPLGPYGSAARGDVPFGLAIAVSERAEDVGAALAGVALHGGGDGPESATEALYRLATGAGETWTHEGGDAFTLRELAADCLGAGWGAACFREEVLAIVVHFTDFCSHQGPPGGDAECTPYAGIAPAPAAWEDAVEALRARGARYVGINTDATACAGADGPLGRTPCWFMRRTAEATDAVDVDGEPLVFDLPNGGGGEAAFVARVAEAIEAVATRVPRDVEASVEDAPGDALDVTRFVEAVGPACGAGEVCWAPPAGGAAEEAVAEVGERGFGGGLPGTRLRFAVQVGGGSAAPATGRSSVHAGTLVARGEGGVELDRLTLQLVLPAAPRAR